MVTVAPVLDSPVQLDVHQVTRNSAVVQWPAKPQRTSHNSKTVLPTVNLGPSAKDRARPLWLR